MSGESSGERPEVPEGGLLDSVLIPTPSVTPLDTPIPTGSTGMSFGTASTGFFTGAEAQFPRGDGVGPSGTAGVEEHPPAAATQEPQFVRDADGHAVAVLEQPDDWAGVIWEGPHAVLGQSLQYDAASIDLRDRDLLLHEPERHRAVRAHQAGVLQVCTSPTFF